MINDAYDLFEEKEAYLSSFYSEAQPKDTTPPDQPTYKIEGSSASHLQAVDHRMRTETLAQPNIMGLRRTMGWYQEVLHDVLKYCYDGKYVKALDELEKVRVLDPSYPGFTLAEAMIHFNLRNFSLALAKYEAALAMDSNFCDYDFNKGEALCMIGYIQYVIYDQKDEGLVKIQQAAEVNHRVATHLVYLIHAGIDIRNVSPRSAPPMDHIRLIYHKDNPHYKNGSGVSVRGFPPSLDFSNCTRFNQETHLRVGTYFSPAYVEIEEREAEKNGYYNDQSDLGISKNTNITTISLGGEFNKFNFFKNAYMPNVRSLMIVSPNHSVNLSRLLPAFPGLKNIGIRKGLDGSDIANNLSTLAPLSLDTLTLHGFSADEILNPDMKDVFSKLQRLNEITIYIESKHESDLIVRSRIEFQKMLPNTKVNIVHHRPPPNLYP